VIKMIGFRKLFIQLKVRMTIYDLIKNNVKQLIYLLAGLTRY